MEIFCIILILQYSRCENTLWSREHLRNISRIFYDTLSFFPLSLPAFSRFPIISIFLV